MDRARRASPHDRRGCRDCVLRVGAGCTSGQRRRRLQRLERRRSADAIAGRGRRLGAVRARGRRRPRLQVRDPRRGRRGPSQGGPVRAAGGVAAQDRIGGLRAASRVDRSGLAGAPARRRAACWADLDLRGASRLVAPQHARGQPLADLRRAGRRAGGLRARAGLHARRADARHGAPVHRLVGLSGDRVLRAHGALWHTGRIPLLRRSAARPRPRRDPRLGACPLPA